MNEDKILGILDALIKQLERNEGFDINGGWHK
jgi:hypothetical protein